MRYLLFALLMMVGMQGAKAQNDSIFGREGILEGAWYIEPGIWVPLGNLHKTFDNSPDLGIGVGCRLGSWRYELGINIVFIGDFRSFDYAGGDTSFVLTSQSVGLGGGGLRVKKLQVLGHSAILEKIMGIGMESLTTGVSRLKPECADYKEDGWHIKDDNCEGSAKYESEDIDTFYLMLGFGLKKLVKGKRLFGAHVEYKFSPYGRHGRVKKGFGNSALVGGLSFQF